MTAQATYQPLVGKSTDGDFVLNHQPLAIEGGFSNVSKVWFDKTKPLSEVLEQLEAREKEVQSYTRSFGELTPVEIAGRFGFRDNRTGKTFFATKRSVRQLGKLLGIGAAYPFSLLKTNRPGNAELLVKIVTHQIPTIKNHRRFVFRVRDNDRLTGVISQTARTFRNCWLLRLLLRTLPDARVSHWRGEDDTLLCNLLIPDTIREESDSEYGALVSLSNCEMLTRVFRVCPSLFRAICMNGCIWGREQGVALTMASFGRGDLDLVKVEALIAANIREQIPLSAKRIEQLLNTRKLKTSVSMKPVIAQLCRDFRIDRESSLAILRGWNQETRETPDYGPTLFGVLNGVTRAGQSLSPDRWVRFDELGGTLASYEPDRWESLVSRASKLRATQVDSAFGDYNPLLN